MTIEVRWWDEAETVLYHQYVGKWNWDDFHQKIRLAVEMIAAKPYRVDSIVDYRASDLNISGALQRVYPTLQQTPANLHRSYVLAPNTPFIRMMYGMFSRLFGGMKEASRFVLLFDSTPEQIYLRILEERAGR